MPERKQHPQKGVKREDIPAPKQPEMDQADDQQHKHPAVKHLQAFAALGQGMPQHDGKTDPEQDGKNRIELAVDKEIQQVAQHPVQARGLQTGGILHGKERIEGELRVIRQADAQQCETAKGVQDDISFFDRLHTVRKTVDLKANIHNCTFAKKSVA